LRPIFGIDYAREDQTRHIGDCSDRNEPNHVFTSAIPNVTVYSPTVVRVPVTLDRTLLPEVCSRKVRSRLQ